MMTTSCINRLIAPRTTGAMMNASY